MFKLQSLRRKKNRSNGKKRAMRFESLESRTLLAADFAAFDMLPVDVDIDPIDPPAGVVVAEGTEGNDFIFAFVDPGNRLHVSVNGNVETYDNSEVEKIIVNAKGGDDIVWMSPNILQQTGIRGGEGNDRLYGGGGSDIIHGGEGADRIFGGFGNDLLVGGDGNDVMYGQFGNDALVGGRGNDRLYGGRDADAMAGGSGDDYLNGGQGADWIFGDATNDVPEDYAGLVDYARKYANTNTGNDEIVGGDGNDILLAGNGDDLVYGGDGSDIILGGRGDDNVRAGDGRDFVLGGVGSDNLDGGNGADLLIGDPLNAPETTPGDPVEEPEVSDRIVRDGLPEADDLFRKIDAASATPSDALVAAVDAVFTYDDTIYGGAGNDILLGMRGNDRLFGGRGNDLMHGGTGNDRLEGGAGNDLLVGAAGNDLLFGQLGNDRLFGGRGRDIILGGSGNDQIRGGSGDDVLLGGAGDDSLHGGAGSDFMYGGLGADKIDARDGEIDFIILDADDEVDADDEDVIFEI